MLLFLYFPFLCLISVRHHDLITMANTFEHYAELFLSPDLDGWNSVPRIALITPSAFDTYVCIRDVYIFRFNFTISLV